MIIGKLKIVLVLVLATQLVSAAQCLQKGCKRYAGTSGYCQIHQDAAYKDSSRSEYHSTRYSTSPHSSSKKEHPYVVPEILKLWEDFSDHLTLKDGLQNRIWTDRKGKTVDAYLTHISQDHKTLYLTFSGTLAKKKIPLEKFSDEDRKYVETLVKKLEAGGMVWYKGSYVGQEHVRFLEVYEKAKSQIRDKDQSISRISCLKVFQALGANGLCTAGHRDEGGRFVSDFSQTIFYKASPKAAAPLADGDLVIERRFFWAGTRTYTTVKDEERTVNVITDDPSYAIDEVMRSLGWKFDDEDKVTTQPRPSAPRDSADLFCTGSGFVITKSGYLITNNHVVREGRKFRVMTASGTLDATLVKTDPETDLAVLKVFGEVKPCSFSQARKEKLGTEIFTMGFPQPGIQGFSPKVTKGVISGLDGFKGDVREYQIDASIQPGNSGGPLFDMSGHIVGVVVASLRSGQVVNYAIKKSYLMAFLDSVGCSDEIVESPVTEGKSLSSVVDEVRNCCVLVLTYK